jgi:hypothetical protein
MGLSRVVARVCRVGSATTLLALAGCGGHAADRSATTAPSHQAVRPSPLLVDRAELVANRTYTTQRFNCGAGWCGTANDHETCRVLRLSHVAPPIAGPLIVMVCAAGTLSHWMDCPSTR